MVSANDFNHIFSFPRMPETLLLPGQHFDLSVPQGKKVLVTDLYIGNEGGGISRTLLMEALAPLPLKFAILFAQNQIVQQLLTLQQV